jgi:glycosyltransferase involved in cell wall biosynthesis
MKIAILNITGGGMSDGYRKYLRNIIPRVAQHPNVEAILCASPGSLNIQSWFQSLFNVEFVDCAPFRFLYHRSGKGLKQYLEKFSADVLFFPPGQHFSFNNTPVVSMVQNMEPFVPNIESTPFSERFRNMVRSINAKKASKKANRVIAVSRYVRDFLISHLNIPKDKIAMVYHGIDLPENKEIPRPDIIPKGWDGQFLFTAGSIRPARGLEDLLLALKLLYDMSPNIPATVIAGETTSGMMKYGKKLRDWVRRNGLSSEVCWASHLNEQEISWCYQNCKIFVMTSRVESFSMIAGEAMSHGCVCISADNPCLPEIFKDAAIYYPPKDVKALTELIRDMLSWDNQQRTEISGRARKRAAKFSWDITAEKTVNELRKAIEGKPKRLT